MSNYVQTFLEGANKVHQYASALGGPSSLIEFAQPTRVEPIVILDEGALHLPYIHDVLQTVNSIYAGYYLQAVSLSMNVGRIDVISMLDKFNPTRDANRPSGVLLNKGLMSDTISGDNGAIGKFMSPAMRAGLRNGNAAMAAEVVGSLHGMETYQHALPIAADIDAGVLTTRRIRPALISVESALSAHGIMNSAHAANIQNAQRQEYREAMANAGAHRSAPEDNTREAIAERQRAVRDEYEDKHGITGTLGVGKDTISSITAGTNLAVGITLEVHVKDGNCDAVIPVTVRLQIAQLNPATIANILTYAEKGKSLKERWHGWKAGQLKFVRDLVLCQDLIDAHRATLLKDTSGVYQEILARRQGNRVAAVASGDPSIATASNIVVMTAATAQSVETEVGGRLSNVGIRERIFKNSYLMLMIVIDPSWEQVTIYHRGIAQPTQVSVKEIKSVNKSKGPDVSEILAAYKLGSAPSI